MSNPEHSFPRNATLMAVLMDYIGDQEKARTRTGRLVVLFMIAVVGIGFFGLIAVLLLGLLRREKSGAGNIGFESVLVLAIYAGAILFQIALG